MRLKICLAVGLAGLFAASMPAIAGDLDNSAAGGIRNYNSGGVPVPVPQYYDETYKWYLRGDIGTAFKNSGTLTNDGMPVNVISPNNWQEQSIISFGVGRYITPSFRAELTLDYHTNRQVEGKSPTTRDFTITKSATNALVTEVDVGLYHGTQIENINYQNSTFMVSGFYDFNNRGSLRPYIGAGIGFARHQLNRVGTETYTCDPNLSTVTLNGLQQSPNSCGSLLNPSIVEKSNVANTGYGLAAQLSAGISYDLTARTHWDTGYRLVWQSGNMAVVSNTGLNSVRLGDQINHEIRTGVRWDLW